MFKYSLLIGGTLLSQALTFSAAAQEISADTEKPQPFHRATAQEKAAGKAHRREEGRAAAKDPNTVRGEVTPQPAPQAKASRAQREETRAARQAETRRAAKAGELLPYGEVGTTK